MMRPFSTTAGYVIGGIFALLLIVYVFANGSLGNADAAPHCTSQQALNQVKGELFRRAAGVRGTTDPGFDAIGRYSVVRAGSRLVRRHYPRSDKVTCTGSIALDLPPGAAVVGGRHTLAANVAYDLAPGAKGSIQLLSLGNADAIVVPLAAITNSTPQQGQMPLQSPEANGPVGEMSVAPATPTAAPPARAPAMQRTPARGAPPEPAPPGPKAPHVTQPPAPRANAPAPVKPRPKASPPPALASARPSFNCAKARTRGEVAICANPSLAALDRQMSAQFYSALRAADPGQRAALEHSRGRFLAYRDGCGSDACIADTYRGRMSEIADIMRGRY